MTVSREPGALLPGRIPAARFQIIRLEPAGSPLHPFELGHVCFQHCAGSIDTSQSTRLAHMVHLTLQDLVDGLLFLAEGGNGFLLMAAASSLEVDVRCRNGTVDLSAGASSLRGIPLLDLLDSVATTTQQHLARTPWPSPAPSILQDLERSTLRLVAVVHARRAG